MIPDEFYCYGCQGDSRLCACVSPGYAGEQEQAEAESRQEYDEAVWLDNYRMAEYIRQVEAGRSSDV